MNLHEECLLKYLLNTTNLSSHTEVLNFNIKLIESESKNTTNYNKQNIVNYITGTV